MDLLSRALVLIEEGFEGLLGRKAEAAEASRFLEEIASGASGALVVTGEPGIGKTAFARQVAANAARRDFRTAWSWCWTATEAPPFWPWKQVARDLDWDDVHWTDIPSAFASMAEQARSGSPTLIVLDDAQGADESSLSLVNLFVRSLPSTPIGFVVTVCEEDLPQSSGVAHLLDEIARGGRRLDLFGLDKQATHELVKQLGNDKIPPLIQEAIASASDGNPFLVEQLARETSAGRDVHRPDQSLGFNVPRGADAVLDRVLGRLSPETVSVLSIASVLGRVFSVEVLADMGKVDANEISRSLTEATDKGAIRRVDSLGTYEFTHALLRERLYERLTDDERRALHLGAARATEKGSDPSLLGELAHHLFKAGPRQPNIDQAVKVIVRAAEEADSSGSPDGSARHLYRAGRLARAAGLIDVADDLERQLASARTEARQEPKHHRARSGTFKKEGEYWSVGLDGSPALVKDSRGMGYLASLVSTPQREWHCLELAAPAARGERPADSDTGPVLDAQAKAQFRQRLLDIEEEIAEASEYNDDGRLRKAEAEKQFLLDELSAATGLGGRDRIVGSDSERARVAVTRAIRSALRRIAAAHPSLGDHLDRTIQTGTFLSYRPDPMATPEWQL